jgi:hypothetical protein
MIIEVAVGVVAGAVVAVVVPKVYAFVAKQIKSVKADVPAVVAKAETAVVTAVEKKV